MVDSQQQLFTSQLARRLRRLKERLQKYKTKLRGLPEEIHQLEEIIENLKKNSYWLDPEYTVKFIVEMQENRLDYLERSQTRIEDLVKVLLWEIERMIFIIESFEARNDILGGYDIEEVQQRIKDQPIPAMKLKLRKSH